MYCEPCGNPYPGLGVISQRTLVSLPGGTYLAPTAPSYTPPPSEPTYVEPTPIKPPPPPPPAPEPSIVTGPSSPSSPSEPIVSPTGEVPGPTDGIWSPDLHSLPYELVSAGGSGGGGNAPINVSVEASPGVTAPEDRKGFGMTEALIGLGLAALLGAALKGDKKKARR